MNRKPFEGNPFQNPDFNSLWAENFPKVVRYGVLGAVAVSALVWAHSKVSKNPAEVIPPQEQAGPDDQAA